MHQKHPPAKTARALVGVVLRAGATAAAVAVARLAPALGAAPALAATAAPASDPARAVEPAANEDASNAANSTPMLEPFMRQLLRGVRFDRVGWRPVVAGHYSLRPHDVTGIAPTGDALGGT